MNDKERRIINSNFKKVAKWSKGLGQSISTPSYVRFGDGATDAFGNGKVALGTNRADFEFIYNKLPEFFDEITNNGSVTHNANTRDLTLALTGALVGDYATMRGYPVPYTPGNGQLIELTGVLDLAAIGSGTAQLFLRTSISGSVVTNTIDQSSWDNLNQASDIDWTKSHIFFCDFQSLKVGRIRYGFNRSGVDVFVDEIVNDNIRNSGYWQNPSLPPYWRIYNDGTYTYMEMGYGDEANGVGIRYRITANASATMKAICCTVKSFNGVSLFDLPGAQRTVRDALAGQAVSTSLYPVLSIRCRSTFNSLPNLGIAIVESYSVKTDQEIALVCISGGSLTGASWANVNTNESMMEYDNTATAISGGREIFSEFIAAGGVGAGAIANSNTAFLGKSVLWDRQSSETGIFSLCAVQSGGSAPTVKSSLNWREIR